MLHYSSLTEINTQNVTQLKPVWTYKSGDVNIASYSQIQCNPIIIGDKLYGVNPAMKLFAIHAGTGEELWKFDPNLVSNNENNIVFHIMVNSRGIAYWSDEKEERIFFTAGSKTYAIDAKTGKPIKTFGTDGYIDLHDGLGRDVTNLFVVNTSPGMIYNDLLILGTRVDEAPPSAPGHIRAYDTRTGKMEWIFHTIPQPGEEGYETWENPNAYEFIGGANVWSGFALDEKRGILYAPTGSAAYDFYGGKRLGDNLFANCLLALDASTGKRIWHFQFLHHDLWDKDLPTPPTLGTIEQDGRPIDVVMQPTKNGLLYVFDRETGKPVFPVKETPVETTSDLIGEKPSPTQPLPLRPAPFSRQKIGSEDINPFVSATEQERLKQELSKMRNGSPFLPPSKQATIIFPGYDGGAEWGGAAFDPETDMLYLNTNEMAWIMKMLENPMPVARTENYKVAGSRLYQTYCQTCHGKNFKGTGNNPSIVNIKTKSTKAEMLTLFKTGRRMMPAFNQLSTVEKNALATFLLEETENYDKELAIAVSREDSLNHVPYKMEGYTKFLTKEGLPAISPPWGTLNAINMKDASIAWKIPFGDHPKLLEKGITDTGAENYGGPVVTAGGLLFIAATMDGYFRAYDKKTGALLWKYKLPAPGFATPAIYEWNGKQYVVIACGGGKLGTISSDNYIAFGL